MARVTSILLECGFCELEGTLAIAFVAAPFDEASALAAAVAWDDAP